MHAMVKYVPDAQLYSNFFSSFYAGAADKCFHFFPGNKYRKKKKKKRLKDRVNIAAGLGSFVFSSAQ